MLRTLPPVSSSHSEPQSPHIFTGDPPRTASMSDPDFYGISALPWDPVHMKASMCLSRVEYPFSPVLWSSCTKAMLVLNTQCSRASSYQSQIPRGGNLTWGSELSLPWVSLCNVVTFQSVSHPPDGYIMCNRPSCLDMASFVFQSRISFFFFFFFPLFKAVPAAYGSSQARGGIRALAASLYHSHSNTGSKPCLRPAPQLVAKQGQASNLNSFG